MIRMRFISNGVPMNSTGSGKNSAIEGPQNWPGSHSSELLAPTAVGMPTATRPTESRADAKSEASRAFS